MTTNKKTNLERMEAELAELWVTFDSAGGRGVELADKIDELTRSIDNERNCKHSFSCAVCDPDHDEPDVDWCNVCRPTKKEA